MAKQSQNTCLQLPVASTIKLANRGPIYGEEMYKHPHKPILRACSWKKKMSLIYAIDIVCGAVTKKPIVARMA